MSVCDVSPVRSNKRCLLFLGLPFAAALLPDRAHGACACVRCCAQSPWRLIIDRSCAASKALRFLGPTIRLHNRSKQWQLRNYLLKVYKKNCDGLTTHSRSTILYRCGYDWAHLFPFTSCSRHLYQFNWSADETTKNAWRRPFRFERYVWPQAVAWFRIRIYHWLCALRVPTTTNRGELSVQQCLIGFKLFL